MRDEWNLHFGLQSSRLKDATAAKWSLLNRSEHTTSHHENCEVGWSITHRSTRKAVNREMLAVCSFPFCEGSAAVLMQPTFDRGRATWHDAQIRHTMDPPSKQDGRGALHRHDLDGRGQAPPWLEGSVQRVVQEMPEHEKISYSTSRSSSP